MFYTHYKYRNVGPKCAWVYVPNVETKVNLNASFVCAQKRYNISLLL